MQQNITVSEAQSIVDEFISNTGGYWPPFEMLAAIFEEAGELSKMLQLIEGSRAQKERPNFEKLEEEVGDVFFALICLANAYKISLAEALIKTVEKYKKRDFEKYEKYPSKSSP
ncbi:MAG: MazG nucleotide pyrophosphohydrolase domain-containing protein [Candidatus Wukongarchaeota archaeon]|nr:MazG nucleotide pyrophosphohydrolase domain-containing protein [Candidatus Wukongarchaeota archaeon]